MTDPSRQSLLDGMSGADKDALIERLWHDLQAERLRASALEERLRQFQAADAGSAGAGLLGRLRDARSSGARLQQATIGTPAALGRSLGWLRSKVVLGAALLVALIFALDFAIGRYQDYRTEQMKAAARELQHAAYEGLYVELVNLTTEPDGKSYRLTMRMANVEPDRPLYVMQTPVRVFEQSGLAWKEVPARAPGGESATVTRLADAQTYQTVFEPNLKDWTELMPGYMHIRFESISLVSGRSDPDDDIVERTDRYYVYLKPYGADDDAIRRRMKIQGSPPLYMPMPPH